MNKNKDYLVSIIIPVYNVEKYLTDCITSVLRQTYQNIEVILVDDGSKDMSGNICDKFSQNDHRVHVFHIPNSGVSRARNLGITKAKGEFIQFVDSDDTIENNMTESLLTNLLQNKADLVLCGYTKVKEDGTTDISPQEGIYDFEGFIELLRYWLIDPIIGSPCNKLYSRELLINHNIQYDPGTYYAEDYLFNIRYLKYTKKICVFSACPYKYNHMTVGSLHQVNNLDLDRNWKTSVRIIEEAQEAINAHAVNDHGFISQLFLYFITSSVIHRARRYTKKECLEWISWYLA